MSRHSAKFRIELANFIKYYGGIDVVFEQRRCRLKNYIRGQQIDAAFELTPSLDTYREVILQGNQHFHDIYKPAMLSCNHYLMRGRETVRCGHVRDRRDDCRRRIGFARRNASFAGPRTIELLPAGSPTRMKPAYFQSHNSGRDRWMISYLDVLTVLLILFVAIAARESPRPQVTVRVLNQSPLTRATLSIKSGDTSISKAIDLPPEAGERDEFIDMPSMKDVIEVQINAPDDLPADNNAWLVRQRVFPTIEVRDSIPDELQRMIQVYQKNRSANERAPGRVVVTTDSRHLAPNEIGVAVVRPAEAGHYERDVCSNPL
jgi:hypothetical protein